MLKMFTVMVSQIVMEISKQAGEWRLDIDIASKVVEHISQFGVGGL